MVLQFRDGGIPPRIPFALIFSDAQLAAKVLMQVIRRRLRGLDSQSVGEVSRGVIVCSLQSVESLRGFLPDGDNLEGDHIQLARLNRGEVIRQAEMFVKGLAREG